ncbi:ubiquitin carboxyl-terminal hydrolase 19-like, partial [Sycon ciliatum]|uniref:ubiquitin carboxyl-terminal hydrolase 19-like n=1 Tax=Sycon ciliatum TaxID=27933 RepID=UPI0031F5F92C
MTITVSTPEVNFHQTKQDVHLNFSPSSSSPACTPSLVTFSDTQCCVDSRGGASYTILLKHEIDAKRCNYTLSDNSAQMVLRKKTSEEWLLSDWGNVVMRAPCSAGAKDAIGSSSADTSSVSTAASSSKTATVDSHSAGAAVHMCAGNVTPPDSDRSSDDDYASPLTGAAATGAAAVARTYAKGSDGSSGSEGSDGRCASSMRYHPIGPICLRQYAVKPGRTGLRNNGNTCYLNSILQCLSHTRELRHYFIANEFTKDVSVGNPLGYNGHLASAYAKLLAQLWSGEDQSVTPFLLQKILAKRCSQFNSLMQQDAQEFLSALLDGLHEDLNRVKSKPIVPPVESNGRPDDVVAAESWDMYRRRNDSFLVDHMYGQFKSTLVCPTCQMVSIVFDPFMYLTLPVLKPKRIRRVILLPCQLGSQPSMYDIAVSEDEAIGGIRAALLERIGKRAVLLQKVTRGIGYDLADTFPQSVLDKDHPILAVEIPQPGKHGDEKAEDLVRIPLVQRVALPPMPSSCCFCTSRPTAERPLSRCTRCFRVAYCNRSCQQMHWLAHKPGCRLRPAPYGHPAVITIARHEVTYKNLYRWAEHYARMSVDVVARESSSNSKASPTSSPAQSPSSSATIVSDHSVTAAPDSPSSSTCTSSAVQTSADKQSTTTAMAAETERLPPFHLSWARSATDDKTDRIDRTSNKVLEVPGKGVLLLDWR